MVRFLETESRWNQVTRGWGKGLRSYDVTGIRVSLRDDKVVLDDEDGYTVM